MAIDLDGAVALVTGGAIGGRFACGDVREQADNEAAVTAFERPGPAPDQRRGHPADDRGRGG